MLKDINNLPDDEVLRQLKNKLVATIGTYGSQRGCTFNTALEQFQNDWGENLYTYVVRLKYKNVMDLLADMSQNIRIDRSKSEIRIYAINNEELNHCFDLIDRTPAPRSLRRRGGSGEQNRNPRFRSNRVNNASTFGNSLNFPLKNINNENCYNNNCNLPSITSIKSGGNWKVFEKINSVSSTSLLDPPNLPLKDILNENRYKNNNNNIFPPPPLALINNLENSKILKRMDSKASLSKVSTTSDKSSSNSSLFNSTSSFSLPTINDQGEQPFSSLFHQIWKSYRCKNARNYSLKVTSNNNSKTSSSSLTCTLNDSQFISSLKKDALNYDSSNGSILLKKENIIKIFDSNKFLRKKDCHLSSSNNFTTINDDKICFKKENKSVENLNPKAPILEDLLNMLEEYNGLHLSQLILLFHERFHEHLSAKKLTQLLGLPSNIKNMHVAFMNYKPEIFYFSSSETDPFIRVVRKKPIVEAKDVLIKSTELKEDLEEEDDWKSAMETVYFECD